MYEKLLYSDAESYRRAEMHVLEGAYEAALQQLQEMQRVRTGLYAFVHYRLFEKCPPHNDYDATIVGDDLYLILSGALLAQKIGNDELCQESLNRVKQEGQEKSLPFILKLTNLGQLEPVPPVEDILTDVKKFDAYRKSDPSLSRLAGLEGVTSPYGLMRYAQYLHHNQKRSEDALQLINPLVDSYELAKAIKMFLLAALERNDELITLNDSIEDFEDLGAQICMLESRAFIYAVLQQNFDKAFRVLHNAEGLAKHFKLEHSLNSINIHLENVANMANKQIELKALEPSSDPKAMHFKVKYRFFSHLQSFNYSAIAQMPKDKLIGQSLLTLGKAIEALHAFPKSREGLKDIGLKLSEDPPSHPEFLFTWVLAMLEFMCVFGEASGVYSANRIKTMLNQVVNDLSESELNDVANYSRPILPLGLFIASSINEALQDARRNIPVIYAQDARDGIRINGKKKSTVTQKVREAIIEDGKHGSDDSLKAVFSLNSAYQTRFKEALEKLELQPHQVTNLGAINRGLSFFETDSH